MRARGHHGVLEQERLAGQDFLVDAVLEVDLAPAARTDALAATVDYGRLAVALASAVSGPPVDLLETLVDRLLTVCLADARVRAAEVTVHKPSAPIPVPFVDVAVTGRRRRDRSGLAVLALGSNLGDRLAHLQGGLDFLRARLDVVVTSSLFETTPVGGPPQGDYLNGVLLVEPAPPVRLLALAHAAERAAGRPVGAQRGPRWGPRTLDVDVVDVLGKVSDDPSLTLPHPRAHQRAFVLVPWHEMDPDAALVGHGRVDDLLEQLTGQQLRRFEPGWG